MQYLILVFQILSGLFAFLVVLSSFYCFVKTPRHPRSWLLSIVVSTFYGPCLVLCLVFLVVHFVLNTAFTLVLFTSLLPMLLLLGVMYQKWTFAMPISQFSWQQFFLPQIFSPRPDLSIRLTTSQIPVDFYWAQNPKAPLIFFLFGGGFENNDHKQHPHFLKYLSTEGFHVASVGYRQLPHHPWPQSLIDIENVINLIMRQNPSPLISPDQFIVMGRSAGGFLALSASRLQFEKPLAACIAIYPVTDLSLWSSDTISNSVLQSRRRSFALVQNDTTIFDRISLIQNPLNFHIPYYVVTGDADPVVDHHQTLKLQAHLNQQGIKNKCLVLRSETHGFDFHLGSFASQLWTNDMINFLKSVNSKESNLSQL